MVLQRDIHCYLKLERDKQDVLINNNKTEIVVYLGSIHSSAVSVLPTQLIRADSPIESICQTIN